MVEGAAHVEAVGDAREGLEGSVGRLAPSRRMLVSEWAAESIVLTKDVTPDPGKWDNNRAPYQAEMMDAILEPGVEDVVFETSSQIGKTSIIGNVLGYFIDHDPTLILVVQPTVELGQAWSKERLVPMIEASERLRDKVSEAKSRDSDNTIMSKKIRGGGRLNVTGANAPGGLAMRPVRVVLCDEVDRFPNSAGSEGDPVALAFKRTENFWNRKRILTSTPTLKGMSRIEEAYNESDRRRFFVPCPACGTMQTLKFNPSGGHGGLVWQYDVDGKPMLDTVRYECANDACRSQIEEIDKPAMLAAGEWVPEFPERKVRGYHINALYSPWRRWDEIVVEWESARKNPERLKVFVNTVLGETWEEEGTGYKADALAARAEKYAAEVPDGVGVLVAAVDVQVDRLEVVVKGFGAGEETWLIDHAVIPGDPEESRVWDELDTYIRKPWKNARGRECFVECTTIDSGGHHTERVYRFTEPRAKRHVYAVKGSAGPRELVGRPSMSERYRTRLYVVGVDTAKDMIFGRLRVRVPGPGYMHLPDSVTREYVEQLVAEKAVKRWRKGRGWVREWTKVRERNEALDLEVYALAALHILGRALIRILPERAKAWAEEGGGEGPGTPQGGPKDAAPGVRRRSGWVSGWRRGV